MTRREALEALAKDVLGARFVVNLAYCDERGILPSFVDLPLLLDRVAKALDPMPPLAAASRVIHDIIDRIFHSNSDPSNPTFRRASDTLYRVIPLSSLLRAPFGLLSSSALFRSSLVYADETSDELLRDLASKAVDAGYIAQGATVRGRHSFAWTATSDAIFLPLIARLGATEDTPAESLCRRLAIEGFRKNEALFLMQYPRLKDASVNVRRPTALDGYGCLFFKARTDMDRANTAHDTGFTIDIDAVSLMDMSKEPPSSCDGLPEFAAVPVAFSSLFKVYWLGRFDDGYVACDEDKVSAAIAGTFAFSDAVDRALDRLTKT